MTLIYHHMHMCDFFLLPFFIRKIWLIEMKTNVYISTDRELSSSWITLPLFILFFNKKKRRRKVTFWLRHRGSNNILSFDRHIDLSNWICSVLVCPRKKKKNRLCVFLLRLIWTIYIGYHRLIRMSIRKR